jgi:hypothetical protein
MRKALLPVMMIVPAVIAGYIQYQQRIEYMKEYPNVTMNWPEVLVMAGIWAGIGMVAWMLPDIWKFLLNRISETSRAVQGK